MKKHLITLALCACGVAQATPIKYDFSYAAMDGTLSGSLYGTLQADNNTIVVDSISDFFTFAGIAGPSVPFVYSNESLFSITVTGAPRVSIDGSDMSLYACAESSCSQGFVLDTTGLISGSPLFLVGFTYDALGSAVVTSEDYVSSRWSITQADTPATVPEPAGLAVLSLALAGLVSRKRLFGPGAGVATHGAQPA